MEAAAKELWGDSSQASENRKSEKSGGGALTTVERSAKFVFPSFTDKAVFILRCSDEF